MLIKLSELIKKHKLKIKGILHIGAHECEEKTEYEKCNIKNIYWVEAIENKVNFIKNKYKNINIYNATISDNDGEKVDFNISSNGQSSSILELGTHKEKHPGVIYIRKEHHITKRLDTLINEKNINIENINFLLLDIQGVELKAIKGLGNYIDNIDYIFTEVNEEHLYKGCNLIGEIDQYLELFNFKREETIMTNYCWGDALYIKKKLIRKLEKEDYHKGFLKLINYFTKSPIQKSYEQFIEIFDNIKDSIILVIEKDNKIIGTAKLLVEQKFHNNFLKMGHIEDVVVLEEYREKGYGSKLVKELINLGKKEECYKIVLNCNLENINYYENLGFIRKGQEMSLYF